MSTKISRMGMPVDVLNSVNLVWKKKITNRADWGSYGYKLYKFTTIHKDVFWGLNIWKINSDGIYKSLDVASIKDIELIDCGMKIYLIDRPPMVIYRDDYERKCYSKQ